MLFWTLTITLLTIAFVLCVLGRLVRQWAYHAGHGFGLGPVNTPRLLRGLRWPVFWLMGGLCTLAGCGFVILAIGVGRQLLFGAVTVGLIAIGRFTGNVFFYLLFKADLQYSYEKLDGRKTESRAM